jgi:hypothetical protein
LRGAVSGALAAAVWALEQPLDKLLFGSRYDDVELLGRAMISGDGWYPAGLVFHIQNGAIFGAIYANVAPVLPLPAPLRGPAAALTEHVALWRLGAFTDRFHPARRQLTPLTGNRRAFAQGAWRHLLFGIVLGELERRLNAEREPVRPEPDAKFSTNGHGSFERAVPVEPAS